MERHESKRVEEEYRESQYQNRKHSLIWHVDEYTRFVIIDGRVEGGNVY